MHRAVDWQGWRTPGHRYRRLFELAERAVQVWRSEGAGSVAVKLFQFLRRHIRTAPAPEKPHSPALAREEEEVVIIEQDGDFDAQFFVGLDAWKYSRRAAIRMFVRQWQDKPIRKPFPEFHPGIYASRCNLLQVPTRPNPLAHYILRGKPQGPWNAKLIRAAADRIPSEGLKVALHVHAYYPEMLAEILSRVALNSARCDLFITATSAEDAGAIGKILASRTDLKAEMLTVPNRGRDIGAFLHVLERLQAYDVVGHLHTKKSPDLDPRMAEAWRNFLMANLLGDSFPMMDVTLAEFEAQPKLGVVFPDDPYIIGWTQNREPARLVLHRLGIDLTLPDYFDFPMGSMFWARPRALAPLIRAKLQWQEFPAEPLPYDGTILHALERLIPFIAAHEGYDHAQTFIPGVVR